MEKPVNEFELNFADGDIIFHEGQRSSSAYVLVAGSVELVKNSANGPLRLALVSPGELFGEMGIVNRTTRSATARAIGDTVVELVERDEFLDSLNKKPEVALKVIGNLSERLRLTNEKAAEANAEQINSPARRSFWSLLTTILTHKRRQKRVLDIRVAPLGGDPDGVQTERIVNLLNAESALRVRALDQPLMTDPRNENAAELTAAMGVARRQLVAERADILIWGAVNEVATAIHLKFVSWEVDLDYPGAFLPTDQMVLPANFSDDYGKLLFAVSVAATAPRSEAHRRWLQPMLTKALEAAQGSSQQPPMELSLSDQATIQICYGNVAASIGHMTGNVDWHQRAAQAYQEALENISQTDAPLNWGGVQYHLGIVRQSIGERTRDREVLKIAAENIRDATEIFTIKEFPREWACLQNRLGRILFKVDGNSTDSETLKQTIAAFQSALQVFTKAETPLKWAEVKNGIGQALQMWGDVARNEELLEKAVECCQDALQVRSREETPMLWAASQNNLGSALYLLARLTEDSEHLEGAAEAFGNALEIYLAYGAARLGKVTERNLIKAEDLLRARMARKVAKVYWEDEPVLERAERLDQRIEPAHDGQSPARIPAILKTPTKV